MKLTLALLLIVHDPCSLTPWIETATPSAATRSAGEVTVEVLEKRREPFVGDAHGISSIRGTPTGNAALEILSDREMRAYGWCFSVNGVEPGVFADEVILARDDDVVRWYFGSAHYLDGRWLTMCDPSHLAPRPFLCGERP